MPDPVVVHDPGGLGFRVERLWAYLAVHDDGDEGVIAATLGGLPLVPLVAADEVRLAQLDPIARRLAAETGKRVVRVRFDSRVDEEAIEP